MANLKNFSYCSQSLIKFYKMIKNYNFDDITDERLEYLDKVVLKYKLYCTNRTFGYLSRAIFSAERMIVSGRTMGLLNEAEMLYFYINVVDPELKFLEASEVSSKIEDVKAICHENFYYYDGNLIKYERAYNRKFNIIDIDDLWSRNSIKLVRAPKE